MDKLQTLRATYRDIEASWKAAGLEERETFVSGLRALEEDLTDIRGIEATRLLHDIRYLGGQIQEKIVPGQRRRTIDQLRTEQGLVADGR